MKKLFLLVVVAMLSSYTALAENNGDKKVFEVENPDKQLSPYTGMTREHWKQAAQYLLSTAFEYVKDIDSPMELPKQEGKGYPRNPGEIPTARMEAFCRTMFLAGPLVKENPGLTIKGINVGEYYRHQMAMFLDPKGPMFLPEKRGGGNGGQKLVELGGLSLSLLLAPDVFWTPLPQSTRDSLAARMLTYGEGGTIDMNWRFFNMCIMSFFKSQGYKVKDSYLEELIHKNLDAYVGDGWYHDAPLFDYYSMWAFQMYGPLWAESFGKKFYPSEAKQFMEHLTEIPNQYPYMFGRDGKIQMWGRSITYRMGCAVPLAMTGLLNSSDIDYGWMRRICSGAILQFLTHPDFLAEDGVPNLGFYKHFEPCLQTYSCRGSVFWMAKLFLALYIPADNPFWTAKETEGAWTSIEKMKDSPKFIYASKPKILTTNYPSTGMSEFRNVFRKNSGFYYGMENYNRLAYNSSLLWQADGPNGEVAMCYLTKNSKGEWETVESYEGEGFSASDDFFRRTAVLASDRNVKFEFAEKCLYNGLLRIDKISAPDSHMFRMGYYALPEYPGTPIKEKVVNVGGKTAYIIDNGKFQLATVMLDGWDGMEFVHCDGLHPETQKSTVVDLYAEFSGERTLKTLMFATKSGEKLNLKKLMKRALE